MFKYVAFRVADPSFRDMNVVLHSAVGYIMQLTHMGFFVCKTNANMGQNLIGNFYPMDRRRHINEF